MSLQLVALSLLGLASASPIAGRQVSAPPPPPTTFSSQGFNLVVNVTDPTRDLTPSVQGNFVNSIHVGAGLALVGVGAPDNNPRIFYQNGTADELEYSQGTVVSDGGSPLAPYGFSLTADEGSQSASTAHLNGGFGTKGVGLTVFPEPYTFLFPENFAVCNESVPYYQNENFFILRQFDVTYGSDGIAIDNIPSECAPVRIFPQCAQLEDLPADSIASHEYAATSLCYKSVAAIL